METLQKRWKALLFVVFSLQPFYAIAQDLNTIAVIPAASSDLSSEDAWRLAGYLDQQIRERYSYMHLDETSLVQYFAAHRLPKTTDVSALHQIAKDLNVSLLIISKASITENGLDLRLDLRISLFDQRLGSVKKTIAETCDCQPNDPQSFPLRKIVASLFDAPEIILSSESSIAEALPLPTPLEIPIIEPETDISQPDSSRVQPIPVEAPEPKPVIQKRKAWHKYAVGALLLGGGAIYLSTRGNAEGVAIPEKLADAPPVPGSTAK